MPKKDKEIFMEEIGNKIKQGSNLLLIFGAKVKFQDVESITAK